MSLSIEPLREEHLAAAMGFDAAFLVESRLSLQLRDGEIGYDVVPVSPYTKRYDQATDVEELRAYLSDEDSAAFVAIESGAVIGRLLLSSSWNGYALIDDIAVDAAARRCGAGSALIDCALAWAREVGLPGVMLETQDNNVAACGLYERKGFVLGGFDRFYYANDPSVANETALFWYQSVTLNA